MTLLLKTYSGLLCEDSPVMVYGDTIAANNMVWYTTAQSREAVECHPEKRPNHLAKFLQFADDQHTHREAMPCHTTTTLHAAGLTNHITLLAAAPLITMCSAWLVHMFEFGKKVEFTTRAQEEWQDSIY
uniref:Uncharacterized protein n=1 Tax=Oryza brachyantha TaxID=4533 RepID=J3N8U0_ORYBR